jgi:hypothetical protein
MLLNTSKRDSAILKLAFVRYEWRSSRQEKRVLADLISVARVEHKSDVSFVELEQELRDAVFERGLVEIVVFWMTANPSRCRTAAMASASGAAFGSEGCHA